MVYLVFESGRPMLIKITGHQIDRVKIPFKTLRFLAYFPISD